MYLHISLIRCCRCSFLGWCICTVLISIVADTLFRTDVSATCFSLNLQILFILPDMYNCIYIFPFLGLEDTSFSNFTSASHVFYDLRMLSIKILHLQPALSMTCRYSPSKLCIFNFWKSIIADISATLVQQSSALSFIKHAITYKLKTNRIHFSEYDRGVGNT